MRTTVDVDEDILEAAKELARRQRRTLGEVISQLARTGLQAGAPRAPTGKESESFFGFRPFASRGAPVTNEAIDRLRDDSGV